MTYLKPHLFIRVAFVMACINQIALSQSDSRYAPRKKGPGIPKITYQQNELFKPMGAIKNRLGQNLFALVNGYALGIFGPDAPGQGGGFTMWDISDPKNIKNAKTMDNSDTQILREVHGMGFYSDSLHDYAVFQTGPGLMFWNLTDPLDPKLVKRFDLPDAKAGDYGDAIWHVSWAGKYVYASGSTLGLYIVDAGDPANPKLLKRLNNGQLGGFTIGQVYPVGNLLVLTHMGLGGEKGITTMDISDPINPKMLFTTRDHATGYSTHFNGGKLYIDAVDDKVHIWNLSQPTNGKKESDFSLGGRGEYLLHQDEFMHVGRESFYAKYDLKNRKEVGRCPLPDGHSQEGFATPFGHLVIIGDDHGGGSGIVAHQTTPDIRGPEVNFVYPVDRATNQAVTSRIGLTFTDLIDIHSLGERSVIVRPVGQNGPGIPGYYTHSIGIVNFMPLQPFEVNTSYEILVPKGGVRDYAGNPTETEFRAFFSTGNQVTIPASLFVQHNHWRGVSQKSSRISSWVLGRNFPTGNGKQTLNLKLTP